MLLTACHYQENALTQHRDIAALRCHRDVDKPDLGEPRREPKPGEAKIVVRLLMQLPHEWTGHDEPASRPQQPVGFLEKLYRIVNVLEDLGTENGVELVWIERQRPSGIHQHIDRSLAVLAQVGADG